MNTFNPTFMRASMVADKDAPPPAGLAQKMEAQ